MIDLEAFRERSMNIAGLAGAAGTILNPEQRATELDRLNDELLMILDDIYKAVEGDQ